MPRLVWRVKLEDGRHVVELEHSEWFGKRRIRVDGYIIHESWLPFDLGSRHPFRLGEHECAVVIQYRLLFSYDLLIDGRPVQEWHPPASGPSAEVVPADVPAGRGDEPIPAPADRSGDCRHG